MDIAQAGLKHRPFHKRGKPVVVVHNQPERAAQYFLKTIATSDRGIGFFYGPELSGKKTVISQFVRGLPSDIAVAIVDAAKVSAVEFVDAVHSWFGRVPSFGSPEEALDELEAFVLREAGEGRPPFLFVENLNKMYPSALNVLCHLATLKVDGNFAVRMILVSDKPSFNIISAPAMRPIAKRMVSAFEMGPMTMAETTSYLHAKLRESGRADPDVVLPMGVCHQLHAASHGWPGRLDDLALRAIERADEWPIRIEDVLPMVHHSLPVARSDLAIVQEPVDREVQKLYLTLNRETLEEFELKDSKTLIGRSETCDVCINSRFISKHHALLIRENDTMHLVDLHSTNGTFVNSRRVESSLLGHDDVISLGNHGIKLIAPAYRSKPGDEAFDLAETTTMKTLEDMRRAKGLADDGIPVLREQES